MPIKPHIDSLAKTLVASGIKLAFGVSGGGPSLELITALEKYGVKFFSVAYEGAAAMMAGAASADGKTRAVAISIKGPGFINLLPGILSNFYENRPALTVSEAYRSDEPPLRLHKRLDHFQIAAPLLKAWAPYDGEAATINSLLQAAQGGIPGPVHLDLYAEPGPQGALILSDVKGSERGLKPIKAEIIDLIRKSEKPSLILGSQVLRHLDWPWPELKIPIAATAAAKGIIDEESSYAAGIVTGEVKEFAPEKAVFKNSDLIIGLCLRAEELLNPVAFEASFINLEVSEGELIAQVFAMLKSKKWGSDLIAKWRQDIKDYLSDDWLPAAVFYRLNELRGNSDLCLVPDVGLFAYVAEIVWRARSAKEFLGSANGRFMGTAIPTAIGAALTRPGQKIICVVGDGGIRPYLAEIKLAVEERLPILFILMSDGGYGTFAAKAKAGGLSQTAYKVKNSSWLKAVQALGCDGEQLNDLGEFDRAFGEWLRVPKPHYLEMHFDAEKYSRMMDKLR